MRWELDWLENRARLSPNKAAVIEEETNTVWTYTQLNGRAKTLANWLYERGVEKGDRIALLAPNHISYFDLLFACSKIGAIFVPLNWRLSWHELSGILQDCTPKYIGVHQQFNEIYQQLPLEKPDPIFIEIWDYPECTPAPAVEIHETDPLAMIYTGGTTGKPKGVVLSHQTILWNGINTILSWGLTDQEVTVNYMPMFHTGGLNALCIPILMMGGTVVIGEGFTGEKAAQSINRYQCTVILLVPTMHHMLVQTEDFKNSQFPSMKVFLSGGAPCPIQIYEAYQRKGLAFKEGYGLTEAGPNNFYITPEEAQVKRGSVGKPMLFNAIRLVKSDGHPAGPNEVGELLISGKHGFSHYWNNEKATNETIQNGWISTGDLAKSDEQGFHYIVGRKKDMIISGGENIYPLEIEHWLAAHPSVNEVAVVGLPDEKWGEIVSAFLVLKNTSIQDDELKAYCEAKLGRYKIPKLFIRLEELPKTHVGKIDKKALKEMQNQR
ncbi:long-chain fatty acid--CoA ligase [Neobacillus niacini]|uniref:class I adenylate-forming enzyme family protein n=1 Tax=Neobacillus niacini TaxID=86668 RepID=UPI0021CB007A|nr:long-chain fatty acid--CoA ligase [Neobacillus niacini]MCM3765995.1 long-chain fatty acid--CoA ligase [Neobacillus niacini]